MPETGSNGAPITLMHLIQPAVAKLQVSEILHGEAVPAIELESAIECALSRPWVTGRLVEALFDVRLYFNAILGIDRAPRRRRKCRTLDRVVRSR
jgi:hypothetical protein